MILTYHLAVHHKQKVVFIIDNTMLQHKYLNVFNYLSLQRIDDTKYLKSITLINNEKYTN